MTARRDNRVFEFYYDISCPFAYIASTRIEALAARTGATLIWRPVLLGAIYRATSAPQGAAGSASDVFNPTKKAITSQSFDRTIARYEIPYRPPPRHPVKTTAALRLLYSVAEEHRPALTKALYRAYWADGKNVSERAVLKDAIKQSGIPDTSRLVNLIDTDKIDGEHQRQQLEKATLEATERGSPGVPAFWIPDEIWEDKLGHSHQGRLYWGQDRMHIVESVLHALNHGRNGDNLQCVPMPLQSLMPRCTRSRIDPSYEVKLEFWYDFSSPWAFLGWTQLARLQRKYGEALHIEMKPFLLGILFRQIGAPNTPMSAVSEQKRKYSSLDHSDWVRWWNAVNRQEGSPDENIDFYWADKFPIRTPSLLRAALVEPRLTETLFCACWERNLDMSSDEILKQVIDEAGFNADRILKQANETRYKNELRQRTKEAKDEGLCGVPSYRVFRRARGQATGDWKQFGGIVWGQDELAVVEDLIAGWDGSSTAAVDDRSIREGVSKL